VGQVGYDACAFCLHSEIPNEEEQTKLA